MAATAIACLLSAPAMAGSIGLGIGSISVDASLGTSSSGISADAGISTSGGTTADASVNVGSHEDTSLAEGDLSIGKSWSELFDANVSLLNANLQASLGLGSGKSHEQTANNQVTAMIAAMDPAAQARFMKLCARILEDPGRFPTLQVTVCRMAL